MSDCTPKPEHEPSVNNLNVVDCSSVIGSGVHGANYLCIYLIFLQSPRQEDLGHAWVRIGVTNVGKFP